MKAKTLLLTLSCALALAGCSGPRLMEQSTLNTSEIELAEKRTVLKAKQSELNMADLDALAARHVKNGVSKVYVVLGYGHASKAADRKADMALKTYVSRLLANGVRDEDVVARAIPLDVPEPVVVVAHDVLVAQGPSDCTDMPGLSSPVVEKETYDYGLGCGVKSLIAQQVANPKDLEGVAGLGGDNDGERAANIVARYKTGAPSAFLPTYIISSLSSGQ